MPWWLQAGRYIVYCPVAGHCWSGMSITVVVFKNSSKADDDVRASGRGGPSLLEQSGQEVWGTGTKQQREGSMRAQHVDRNPYTRSL